MEHEKFRQQILEKLQSLDIEMTNKEKEFSNKEKMLIKHCQEIEGSKINIEEKYNKLFIDYTRELKFHKEETTIETVKEESSKLKLKILNFEKMIDLIIYFFKKIGDQINLNNTINNSMQLNPNYYPLSKIDDGINVENFTLGLLQQKLIELERTIFNNMINEKSMNKGKSVPKFKSNNNIIGEFDFDDINSLSDKINHLTNDNKNLKKQLKEYLSRQMNKLECDQSINFNDSINDQSRIPIKTSKNNLLNKYTDLERKFDEFQNEFIKTKSNIVTASKKNSTNKNQINSKVFPTVKKPTTTFKSCDKSLSRKEETKNENLDSKIKETLKSPLVFNKNLTDVLYNNTVSNNNKKTN